MTTAYHLISKLIEATRDNWNNIFVVLEKEVFFQML